LIAAFNENADQVVERMNESKKLFSSNNNNWLEMTDKKGTKINEYFSNFNKDFKTWRAQAEKVISSGTPQTAETEKQIYANFDAIRLNIDILGEELENLVSIKVIDSKKVLSNMNLIIIIIDAISIIICLFLLIYTLIFIKRNISSIYNTAERIASGDKNIIFNDNYKHEFGKINLSIKKIIDRLYWFEQMMDAIKLPISVIDTNQKWTFINKAAENLIGEKRSNAIGKKCSEWGMPHCNKSDCSLICLENGKIPCLKNRYISFQLQ